MKMHLFVNEILSVKLDRWVETVNLIAGFI
jgi:hypothetical protein